jgi:hypothetical protein
MLLEILHKATLIVAVLGVSLIIVLLEQWIKSKGK